MEVLARVSDRMDLECQNILALSDDYEAIVDEQMSALRQES